MVTIFKYIHIPARMPQNYESTDSDSAPTPSSWSHCSSSTSSLPIHLLIHFSIFQHFSELKLPQPTWLNCHGSLVLLGVHFLQHFNHHSFLQEFSIYYIFLLLNYLQPVWYARKTNHSTLKIFSYLKFDFIVCGLKPWQQPSISRIAVPPHFSVRSLHNIKYIFLLLLQLWNHPWTLYVH